MNILYASVSVLFVVISLLMMWFVVNKKNKKCPYCGKRGYKTEINISEEKEPPPAILTCFSDIIIRTVITKYKCKHCSHQWERKKIKRIEKPKREKVDYDYHTGHTWQ
jgi:transposase-like protein